MKNEKTMKTIYKAICTEHGMGYYKVGDEISRSLQVKLIDGKLTKVYESLEDFSARVSGIVCCSFKVVSELIEEFQPVSKSELQELKDKLRKDMKKKFELIMGI